MKFDFSFFSIEGLILSFTIGGDGSSTTSSSGSDDDDR